ncbi:BlaI/MecI/CopY family transcriptional regulator [Bacillus safensis]|nr:BlaI/MecI/CopY family transcriptional regulator [Bacillus safensis]MCM3138151.1 BlaI/MecI/CopY family transcriptional regulator [Bacillus safensis]
MCDLKRKIYRIIDNMSRFRKNSTIDDLKRKTDKDEKTVRQAVKNLLAKEELKRKKEKREWRF